MSLVQGKDAIAYIYDSVWKPVVCIRNVSFSIATEFVKTSVSGSGKDETVEPTENSCTGSMEGLVSLEEPGTLSLSDLQSYQEAHTKFLLRFQRTAADGSIYTSEAYFYISNSTDTGSFDGMNTFTIEVRRSGSITRIFTPTPTLNTKPVKRYDYTGIGAETSFTSALLIGKSIIEVVKDGLGRAEIVTSGTPVNNEVKYITSTGGFEFPQDFQTGEKAYVIYQDI